MKAMARLTESQRADIADVEKRQMELRTQQKDFEQKLREMMKGIN